MKDRSVSRLEKSAWIISIASVPWYILGNSILYASMLTWLLPIGSFTAAILLGIHITSRHGRVPKLVKWAEGLLVIVPLIWSGVFLGSSVWLAATTFSLWGSCVVSVLLDIDIAKASTNISTMRKSAWGLLLSCLLWSALFALLGANTYEPEYMAPIIMSGTVFLVSWVVALVVTFVDRRRQHGRETTAVGKEEREKPGASSIVKRNVLQQTDTTTPEPLQQVTLPPGFREASKAFEAFNENIEVAHEEMTAKWPFFTAGHPDSPLATKSKHPAHQAQASHPTALLNGRYQTERQLKVGGMAIITLARDSQTGSPCVIKIPRTDTKHDSKINVDKLIMEAAYLRQFNHPSIVKYLDLFTHNNIFHLVVEYIEGEDLFTAFAKKPTEESRIIKWAGQILDALECIHRAGVVHRDLNPGNIMLRNNDDTVVIIDFGTLKPAAVDSGTVVLKPGFEVSEQVTRGYADARSDICSVGGILFYLFTSRPPGFIGSQDVVDVLMNKGVSEHTAKCIEQALRIKPEERFQSATAMRRALCSQRG